VVKIFLGAFAIVLVGSDPLRERLSRDPGRAVHSQPLQVQLAVLLGSTRSPGAAGRGDGARRGGDADGWPGRLTMRGSHCGWASRAARLPPPRARSAEQRRSIMAGLRRRQLARAVRRRGNRSVVTMLARTVFLTLVVAAAERLSSGWTRRPRSSPS
jgi:hypothetical protein